MSTKMEGVSTKILTCFIIFVFCIGDFLSALHITDIKVPSPLATGEGGWLECEWADDGDNIYALKWYLGLDEFYRWTPAETPPVKTFPVKGNPITVDLEASRRGRVRVGQVTLEATGVYRCEVSAEAPSFHTESKVASMTIVDLPDDKPLITGTRPNYQLHEEVRLNCSSPHSQPPSTLTFLVNNEQADPSWLVHYKSREDSSTGLETAVLGLRFALRPRMMRQGFVSVKCIAQILDIYWDSSETLIMGDMPYHASVMEGRASSAYKLSAATTSLVSMAPVLFAFARAW
ncbi:uncharacterized protein LOC135214861 [Macrobrachium nipponense]|uniref:uncharacterized protein LOC135214861 n=1 Tax=Macrobrachium nipponense TaxID=159736 RepID=UPI0030C7A146